MDYFKLPPSVSLVRTRVELLSLNIAAQILEMSQEAALHGVMI